MELLHRLRDRGRLTAPSAVGPSRNPRVGSSRRALPGFVPGLLLGAGLLACEPEPSPPSHPELREALGLGDRTPIHQVLLSGRGDRTRLLPAELTVAPGDVVQFRVVDRRVHLLRFRLDELGDDERGYLEATRQAAFPPLTERDARLVLTFRGAPEGDYPFLVEGYGDPVEGRIRVREPEPEP